MTPFATGTLFTYFEDIWPGTGRPAVTLLAGIAPVEVYESATANFAPPARLKPSVTLPPVCDMTHEAQRRVYTLTC